MYQDNYLKNSYKIMIRNELMKWANEKVWKKYIKNWEWGKKYYLPNIKTHYIYALTVYTKYKVDVMEVHNSQK